MFVLRHNVCDTVDTELSDLPIFCNKNRRVDFQKGAYISARLFHVEMASGTGNLDQKQMNMYGHYSNKRNMATGFTNEYFA